MKFTSIELKAVGRRSAIPTAFYDIINRGMDGILAPADLLLKSVQSPSAFLAWLDQAPESQMWTATYHYIEPLNQDAIEENELLIRATKRNPDGGRMKMNIWLRGDRQVTFVRLDFECRQNMSFAGHCLHDLQEYLKAQGIPWDSIDIYMEGFIREAHIKETLLAALEFDGRGNMVHKRAESQQWGKR